VDLAGKLQLRPGASLAVIDVPADVDLDLTGTGASPAEADAVLAFARDRAELDRCAAVLVAAAGRQALTWVAYPKGGQLGTDLNRDILAAAVQERGVQPVRQIAIDDTWSALRLRT
jgi:hypothetical protein